MAKVKIQVTDNGPFLITGETDYLDGQGRKLVTTSSVYLCRCGKSPRKPYCDGKCQGTFKSVVRKG